eukprot:1387056-Alexandrium_andersonii.AAC.1
MHLLFLRVVVPARCAWAAAQLRAVIAGELTLSAWNEAEEQFGVEQGWRSFAAHEAPAGWLEA